MKLKTVMRNYQVFLPDLKFYQQTVACQYACPVRTDGRAYVNAIARGEYERAYLIARETNPFASTCGWVCGAPCEAACRRGKIDAPVAIRALKRFVNDRYGVYLGESGEKNHSQEWPGYFGPTNALNLGNTIFPTSRSGLNSTYQRGDKLGKRIAIVGAGPAGLSCAHDLSLLGHDVTIFDSASKAGGMLRLGIPGYRLPRELIDLEIEAILALGPEIRLNQTLGIDFSLADLSNEFDSVFIAIGSYRSRTLNVEGEQLDGVLRAIDFLINVNLGGYNLDLGKKILVIGGGNVAMDVARTAARLGHPAQSGGDLEMALDVARTAVRLGATQEVHCLVVESRQEMLADPVEINEAQEEGVIIHNHLAPKSIIGSGGHATGVETSDVSRAFDDQGRFNPKLVPNSNRVWECDSVIVAIGQSGDLDWVIPEDGLKTTPFGSLQIDKLTLATTAKGVFAGGDIAFGPRLIINAVADGQLAARSIHSYLQNLQPRYVRKGYFLTIPKDKYPDAGPVRNYLRWSRSQPPAIPADRRVGVSLVEVGYDESTAQEQGGRCLVCTVNPIFNSDLCIMCNGCVDVCPTNCLRLVPVSSVRGNDTLTAVIERRTESLNTASVMLLEPTLCIRCGLCAARCPTEAITMETFRFTEEVIFEKLD